MAQAHAASPCWANLRADHQATITMQTSSPSNHHHANIITKQPSPCKHQHQATITMQTSSPSNHHHEQGHYTYYRKPLPTKVFSQYLKTPNPEKTDTKPPRKVNPQGLFRILNIDLVKPKKGTTVETIGKSTKKKSKQRCSALTSSCIEVVQVDVRELNRPLLVLAATLAVRYLLSPKALNLTLNPINP